MLEKIISKIEQLQRKLRCSCYKNIEAAKNGKCPGMAGGTKATEYLSEMCIGCPYLCLDWEEIKMTKEEILKELEEITEAIFVSNRRIDVLESELKKLEEPEAWKPENDEKYWYVDNDGEVERCLWHDDTIDQSRYNIGNCFPTKERAKQVAEKIRVLLKLWRYHDMFCPDYVPDWETSRYRYFVYYDTVNNEWDYDWIAGSKRSAEVYFDSPETAKKVCDLMNQEEN